MATGAFEIGNWVKALSKGNLPLESLQAQQLEVARQHGVHLVAYHLAAAPRQAPLRDAMAGQARLAVAWEAACQTEVQRLIDAFTRARIEPLFLKGTALAYGLYPEPWMRPRSDIDLFVAEQDCPEMRRVLSEAGYQPAPHSEEPLVTRQFQMIREVPGGLRHQIDVHWRVLNPASAADVLAFTDARARAVALPRLDGRARGLAPVDAMLLACVHRVLHHDDSDRLIWLYDIHLLARTLDDAAWRRVVDAAGAARVRKVVRASLVKAEDRLGTFIPDGVLRALDAAPSEPTASYLGGRRRQVAIEWLNLRDTRTWTARLALLRQHLLPSPSYILQKYERRHPAWLPLLYARRILAGAPRWLRRRD